MINVVLVEDEMLVLLGMKMCIQDSGHDMKVSATFSSAEAALDFFDKHTADVLISDIRLTGMSGLELIEKIRPNHKQMLIIVLSCYEDFSYARKAYEIGVNKYILKHELAEDELGIMISDMYIAKKSQLTAKDIQIGDFGIDFGRNGFIKTDCKYFAGLITVCGEMDDSQSDKNDISYPMVAEIVQEIMHRDNLGECFLRHHDELLCIFSLDNASTYEQIFTRMGNFFENMSKNIRNYFNKYAYLTVSKSFFDLRDVRMNFNEVKEYSGYIFYKNKPCISWVEQKKINNKGCPEIVFNPQNIFTDRWMSDFEAYISNFFKDQRENWVNADELKIQVVKYVNEFSSFLSKYYDLDINHAFSEETRPNYFSVNGFTNADGLLNWLIKMVKEVKEYVLINEGKETTIARIVAYAEQNYSSNITLTDISEKFHMNPVYVCQLFRKKTGVTFTYYINRLRIEKAKGLLLSTDLTVERISEKVGIRNYNYFFRLFKKITGQTTNQYRKSLN